MKFTIFFSWERKVRKMRKHWDRAREKALKKHQTRQGLLEQLDLLEDKLRVLEEQEINRVDRARLSKELEIGLAGIDAALSSKEESKQ